MSTYSVIPTRQAELKLCHNLNPGQGSLSQAGCQIGHQRMGKRTLRLCAALSLLVLLSGCEGNNVDDLKVPGRWYSAAQVDLGQTVFSANCAGCHGAGAQGTVVDWRKAQADGSYPPPPLNGTAHAWHHPLSILKRTVREGGLKVGGKMPGFGGKLNDDEQAAAIAFFQSQWNQKIYDAWLSRGG